MTAKTILVQLHHKVETFEGINKHLVLVVQMALINYMKTNFAFGHVTEARVGDSMHIHAYDLEPARGSDYRLQLTARLSTDANGVSKLFGLRESANVELETIVALLEEKISPATLFNFTHPVTDVTPTTKPS